MIRFIDRLIYRLQQEHQTIESRDGLVNYLEHNNVLFEELKQIAKEKIDLALTRIFNIIIDIND